MAPEHGFSFDSNIAATGDEILNQMPEVQEHAIAAHEAKQNEAAANAETDSDGTPFDGSVHTGTKLKSGQWRKRKTPGTPGSFVAASRKRNPAATGEVSGVATPDANAEAIATGTVIATMILGACQSIGGDEWEPTQHERDFQTSAWQAYCVAKQIKELSPGTAVLIALGSYAGPRFGKPKTAAKIGRIKTWIGLRIAKRKLTRMFKEKGIDAKVEIQDGVLLLNGEPYKE